MTNKIPPPLGSKQERLDQRDKYWDDRFKFWFKQNMPEGTKLQSEIKEKDKK